MSQHSAHSQDSQDKELETASGGGSALAGVGKVLGAVAGPAVDAYAVYKTVQEGKNLQQETKLNQVDTQLYEDYNKNLQHELDVLRDIANNRKQ